MKTNGTKGVKNDNLHVRMSTLLCYYSVKKDCLRSSRYATIDEKLLIVLYFQDFKETKRC